VTFEVNPVEAEPSVYVDVPIGTGGSASGDGPQRVGLHRVPRWLRRTLAVLGALAVSLVFGLTTARANLYLGPHQTEYRLTTDSTITADFGPLGTLQLDSPAGPLGVRANVGEIPTGLTSERQAATTSDNSLSGLTKDLGSYVSFFSDPQVTINEVVRALALDAGRRTLLSLAALLSLGGAIHAVLGPSRRSELISELGPATLGLGASVTAAAVVAALVAHGGAAAPDLHTLESKAFEDTALEGARVTGQVAAVLDNYGAQAIDIYKDNEKFYADARQSLNLAWIDRIDAENAENLESSDEAEIADEHDDAINFLVISDLHCNVSMAEMIRDSAIASEAVAILNIGDTTMNGTAVEKYCVDALNRARPDGVPMYVVDGNHDSPETTTAESAHGQVILAGDIVNISGVRVLGAPSPAATAEDAGLVAKKDLVTDLGRQLRETACEDGDVDLLLVHEPETGDAVMHSGCVPLQISGHTHKRYDPFQIGKGVRYVNASTAGATTGKLTVGPLHGTAEMTVLRFDPSEDRFIDLRLIQVHPNGEAEVGPAVPIPTPNDTDVTPTSTPKPTNTTPYDGIIRDTPSPTPAPAVPTTPYDGIVTPAPVPTTPYDGIIHYDQPALPDTGDTAPVAEPIDLL